MKLKLPRWLSQPSPSTPGAPALTTPELVAQLEERLVEADSEVAAGETRSQELLLKFSESRTAENLELQESAESDLARLQKLRALVVADLEAARLKLAAEERARLEQLEAELKAKREDLSRDGVLVDELVRACEQVIEVQAKRFELCLVNSRLDSQVHSIRLKLGHASDFRFDPLDYQPSAYQVIEKLKSNVDASQDRNRLRYSLASLLTNWR